MSRLSQLGAGLGLLLGLPNSVRAEDPVQKQPELMTLVREQEARLVNCMARKEGYRDSENAVGETERYGQTAIINGNIVIVLSGRTGLKSIRVADTHYRIAHSRVDRPFLHVDQGFSDRRVAVAHEEPVATAYWIKLQELTDSCRGFNTGTSER